MKKKIIPLLLCLAIVSLATACADSKTAQSGVATNKPDTVERRSNVKETDSKTGETYYLIGDFENYDEATEVKYQGTFGKVTQITKEDEPEKVTYGNQSLKLEIQGTEETFGKLSPIMRMATTGDFFNETTNFTNLSKFTFDIYNAMDYEVTIRFYVDSQVSPIHTREDLILTNDNCEYSIVTRIELEPNQWNHIEIPAEQIKSLKYDVNQLPYAAYGAENLDTVGAFCLMFDRGELHEHTQVFYVDNVRAYLEE